jgi:hypothetical protein
MLEPTLALCARAESHPTQLERLSALARSGIEWTWLAERAEEQGLAPLLYTHLKNAEIQVPEDIRAVLAALTLRHQRANSIRLNVLAEILKVFRKKGIDSLLLKGASLALTVYPSPGLRPMRDIDILVKMADARQAQVVLAEMGFEAWIPEPSSTLSAHHLPVAQKKVDGLSVSLEIHHRLLPSKREPGTFEDLSANAIDISVKGVPTLTLGHAEMLWHIYRHAFAYPLLVEPIRLIWVADFMSTVEKHIDEIDWQKVKVEYLPVWNILPLFHHLTPWTPKVLQKLAIDGTEKPSGVGQVFQGWPRSSLAVQRKKGIERFLIDTFWPSDWWLSLYYGIQRRTPAWWWTRLIRHPLHILHWVLQYLLSTD